MRRNDKEIKDDKLIFDVIKNSEICRVAFFDNDYPYIVPMNYGYKDNLLYFHCSKEGRKIELIRKNNKVGFEIESEYELVKHDISCKWTSKYSSIIGTGDIDIIDDNQGKIAGLDIIMQHHGKTDNEYDDKHLKNMLILKLNITELSGKQSG